MADVDLNELMTTFAGEAAEDVAELELGLLDLEHTPNNRELQAELLRRAHTLKGNASCVGLTAITSVAHAYEEVLERLHEGSLALDAQLVALLLSGVDTFRRLLDDSTNSLTDADRELIAQLSNVTGTSAPLTNTDEAPVEITNVQQRTPTLRVTTEKLNRMLDLAGEIAIARGPVYQLLTTQAVDVAALVEIEQRTNNLQSELRELIMRARMVPIGPLFRGYTRTVRDLAASHGRNIRLVTSGEDVELDTTAVEMLREPLTHMIRNAIDHGIEPSHVRVAAGKPAVGRIELAARHDAGAIAINIADDGRGLDAGAIASRARELGLDVARLSDAELYRLIFEPGFSTSDAVSDLSGRGVGMDIVRRSVESLRGTISISSREGQGTTFTMRLPLTLAVIDGFAISAADETYIVAMENVLECIELPRSEDSSSAEGVLLLRDEIVPYVRLRAFFRLSDEVPERENVLIVRHEGGKAGLAVDVLHGAMQAVIKPLGDYFPPIAGVAGSSILASGRVALVLDTAAILRNVTSNSEVHS